jgi:hypothetical protein
MSNIQITRASAYLIADVLRLADLQDAVLADAILASLVDKLENAEAIGKGDVLRKHRCSPDGAPYYIRVNDDGSCDVYTELVHTDPTSHLFFEQDGYDAALDRLPAFQVHETNHPNFYDELDQFRATMVNSKVKKALIAINSAGSVRAVDRWPTGYCSFSHYHTELMKTVVQQNKCSCGRIFDVTVGMCVEHHKLGWRLRGG